VYSENPFISIFIQISSLFAILWSLSVLLYLFGHVKPLSEIVQVDLNPGILYTSIVVFLINPIPIFFYKARTWLLRRLWRLVGCGFYPVEFADFWLADQLNSLVVVLLDAELLVCFYASGQEGLTCNPYSHVIRAVISCYPAWIRFAQCLKRYHDTKKWFPHLANAGKYSTTFFKVVFRALYVIHKSETHENQSVYFFLWMACAFISSCYALAWDIKMDWGFLDANAGDNKFLREEIVYEDKALYYFAIVENTIVRFSWVVKVCVEQLYNNSSINIIVGNILTIMEVLRRFVWNFFRLENEHLNNCGEFRAVRDISVTPFHADDIRTLEKMVDDHDGVEHVLFENYEKNASSVEMKNLKKASFRKNRGGNLSIPIDDDSDSSMV